MNDRLPPHSPENESAILGCILISPSDCLPRCLEQFGSGENFFYDLRNQAVFDVMVEMFNRAEPVEVITLTERLKEKQLLEKIGGWPGLSAHQDAVSSVANLEWYISNVREKYLLRKLLKSCAEISSRVYDYDDVDALLDDAEREILSISNRRDSNHTDPVKELAKKAVNQIEESFNRKGTISGISTGLTDLDIVTDGLRSGEMTVIAALPGCGKTSLAMNIAEHAILVEHIPVGVFSLEMSAVSLVKRFICSHGRVNMTNVRRGYLVESDFPKLCKASMDIGNSSIYFDDSSDLTIGQLRAKARRMWQANGIKLVVVDYLQLLHATTQRKNDSRQEEVAVISRGIKAMSKELNVPVIALSQLNDEGKLRESRAIGQDADNVFVLERENPKAQTTDAEPMNLWIQKQRNGESGVKVDLIFLKPYTRFESAARISNEDIPSYDHD